MAKAKVKAKTEFGLEPALTKVLLLLAFDEKIKSRYILDPKKFVDSWPEKLKPTVKTALKSRDSALIAKELISQHGSTSGVRSRKRAPQGKTRAKRSR